MAKDLINRPFAPTLSSVTGIRIQETTWGDFDNQTGALQGIPAGSMLSEPPDTPVYVELLVGAPMASSTLAPATVVVLKQVKPPNHTLFVWTPPPGSPFAANDMSGALPAWFESLKATAQG